MLVHILKFPLPKVRIKYKISPTFFLSPCLIRIFTQKSGTRVLCHERSVMWCCWSSSERVASHEFMLSVITEHVNVVTQVLKVSFCLKNDMDANLKIKKNLAEF